MRRYLLPVVILALFAGLIAVFAVGLNRDPTFVPSPLIGKPAPDFDLPDLREPGKRVTAADLRGQMTLLNVWATWCSGCRQEHEALLAIARESGVPIVGLNWKDDPESARRWLQALGDPYVSVPVDQQGDVAIDWGVYGAPETFLIGPDGTVLYKHIAPITAEVWEREFLPRIRAGASGS